MQEGAKTMQVIVLDEDAQSRAVDPLDNKTASRRTRDQGLSLHHDSYFSLGFLKSRVSAKLQFLQMTSFNK